jgi:hypothetical protein
MADDSMALLDTLRKAGTNGDVDFPRQGPGGPGGRTDGGCRRGCGIHRRRDRTKLDQIGLRTTQQTLALEPGETARHRLEQNGRRAAPVRDLGGLTSRDAPQDRAGLTP